MNVDEFKRQIVIEEHRTPAGLVQVKASLNVLATTLIAPQQWNHPGSTREIIQDTLKNDLVQRVIALGKALDADGPKVEQQRNEGTKEEGV